MSADTILFQYCQKLVVLSADRRCVLLAKRKGEANYDGTYSFIGGKMETNDASLVAGVKREKNEEVGSAVRLNVLADETYNVLFRKKDGNSVILPHIASLYTTGDIQLSDEYSDYKWAPVTELTTFEPKIANIPELVGWAIRKLPAPDVHLTEI
jgi:8-oxo-dGTP pyrophosphatase MutT (NUDIX family)